jgi:multiple sugar transport system substrate-binding protein
MRKTISFSIMRHNPETVDNLKTVLEKIQAEIPVDTMIDEIDYESGWSEFIRGSIHGGNYSISEMGSTWIKDFAAMNALRPFTSAEITQMGGAQSFVPALWNSGMLAEGKIWAIPWMTDFSLFYYRRDLLSKAGVDEQVAFNSPANFALALQKLQDTGIESPWVVPTQRSYITLHNLAMWVWHTGLDFVDTDGKRVTLSEPAGYAAVKAYFDLYRYLSPSARKLDERSSDEMFSQGRAALTISGPWLMKYCDPMVNENLGLAIPFGCAYIGGSSLVVWKNTNMTREAIYIISQLTNRDAQLTFPESIGLLPARLNALEHLPMTLTDQTLHQVIVRALETGRSFPNAPLWGMIEDRLVNICSALWNSILAEPEPDLDALIEQNATSIIKRLNLTLSTNG